MAVLDNDELRIGHLDIMVIKKLINPDTHPTAPIYEIDFLRHNGEPIDEVSVRWTRRDVDDLVLFFLGSR